MSGPAKISIKSVGGLWIRIFLTIDVCKVSFDSDKSFLLNLLYSSSLLYYPVIELVEIKNKNIESTSCP